MAEAALFSVATAILRSIAAEIAKPGGSFASQKIQLFCCAKDELQSLDNTVQTIQAVLLDAEKQQYHNNQVKLWLGRLKDVLYDLQDLLDDVATEDLRRKVTPGNKMLKVVRVFFSKSNQLAYRLKVTNEIQKLRKGLDQIKKDREEFHFQEHRSEATMAISREKKTEIFAPDRSIIGRKGDKKKIKRLLFDSSSSQSVSFVAIVGKGGLGKTALARLVYNDGKVKEHFGLKMWVCVSDVFDVNLIIKEILKSAEVDCQGHDDGDEIKKLLRDLKNKPIGQLPSLLRDIIIRKKYLLVLDDLWNEDRDKWLKLGEWLEDGLRGSKILVTARSRKVAQVTNAKSLIHDLHGLSEDKSWNLFRRMAFGDGAEPLGPELEKTGRDIVKKCAGVPLAIRTIGCLLYGKEKDQWNRYKVKELPEIPEIDAVDNGIMQVLKFSYNHLSSCLKHCFAYCSLFPKDYVYEKDMMIHLWMAQGFIESRNKKDNLEEVASNYLSELLCRSFLDVARKGDDGEVLNFKMHDLMHDLAQKVAGGECKIVNFKGGDNDRGIRHASFISRIFLEEETVSLLKISKLRTFLCLEGKSSVINSPKIFSEWRHCRALGLGNTDIPLPPSSFGKLKQLSFLNISANQSIQSLPDSITDLVNLQSLILFKCENLRTFPRDLRKLVNLRYFLINECVSLSHVPPFSELPSLRTLVLEGLNALKFLQQTGDPQQSISTRPFFPSLEGLFLRNCKILKGWEGGRQAMRAYQEHRSNNSWPSFPELRSVEIRDCPDLNFVPPFPKVEHLSIGSTQMLEQQLMANPNCLSKGKVESTFVPFSKLKRLVLIGKLMKPSAHETLFRVASNLESMRLMFCDLRILNCGTQHLSSLQELDIYFLILGNSLCRRRKHDIQWQFLTNLRVLKLTNCFDWLAQREGIQHASLEGIQHITTLRSLEISCRYLRRLPEWIGNISSLEKLVLSNCPNLKHLPSMRNLTCLKELRIISCPALGKRCLPDMHIPVIISEDESSDSD
ncbi:hypothetical protein BT93_H1834 [Corymbia citriodora subsp. variegata]|nr:hypothetical protein BT93_H1834 [Corymbia citriodora subsp. variegata]